MGLFGPTSTVFDEQLGMYVMIVDISVSHLFFQDINFCTSLPVAVNFQPKLVFPKLFSAGTPLDSE